MTRDVVILDYGFGNIRSAQRALERAGARVEVTSDVQRAAECDGLVVPGVGAFEACMRGLNELNAPQMIRRRIAAERPVLGICVGMQVMFAEGTEHGVSVHGIGALGGQVERLRADVLPHMGWNTLRAPDESRLLHGVDADTRFYFVHTYAATRTDADVRVAMCEYGEPFIASIEHGSLSATQFHPEKSGDAGAHLLANWMETL
ncbi:MAG: imidazole glycerol phosphate synthase subunit HisH [Cumulibacter sp.]